MSSKRDFLIQSILKSKQSVIPDTIEKNDSPEISIMPVNINKNIFSQEISEITNKAQPILNCKCSLEIKIVARKLYQNILRQMEVKRKRFIRFKQVARRRRARVHDKGTNTTNTPSITPEIVRYVDNGTNTSIEMLNHVVSDSNIPITNSAIVTYEDKDKEVESPEPTSISPVCMNDRKANLIEEILAKANLKINKNLAKNKKNKPKTRRKSLRKKQEAVNDYKNPSKSKSPQLNLHSSSSSENEMRVHTVTAQIHRIPRITNRLSEDNIQCDDEVNAIIKACDKNKNEKPVEKNRRDSEDFMHDSVLSNTFYLTHINPTLPNDVNKNVETCVEDKTDKNHKIAEELVSDISPDIARCAPEPNVSKEFFHIKMKPGSKKTKNQPKINEIYPVKKKKKAVATKIKQKDYSHQIYRNAYLFNTQCSSSSLSSECNEKSQPYELQELTALPQLDVLTLNEQEIPPSNIELPKYTKLKIITRKHKKMGKKLLYYTENDFDYENEENAGKRAVCHKRSQVEKDENIVIDNNSVMYTEEILKRNTQLINKNAAHRKRKELLKRQSPIEIIDKSFIHRTYNTNDLDKSLYSMQSSLESLPYNEANESFYCSDADEYHHIFSSTQFVDFNNRDFVSPSNMLSPII